MNEAAEYTTEVPQYLSSSFDLISITVQLKPSRYLQANVYSRKHVTGIVYNIETRRNYIFHKKYYFAIPKEQIS